jgi:disulfide bond formation protein DsbB
MNLIALAFPPTQTGRALWILLAALATLAAAWTLQALGYRPCELCLTERYAFYAGAPLAALVAFLGARGSTGLARAGLLLLALAFLANAALAGYHAGVEYHFWPGPTACAGAMTAPIDVNDLLKQAQAAPEPRCDEAALAIFGLSLAGWDMAVSAALAVYAALAARFAR